jgi:hypothetical protein
MSGEISTMTDKECLETQYLEYFLNYCGWSLDRLQKVVDNKRKLEQQGIELPEVVPRESNKMTDHEKLGLIRDMVLGTLHAGNQSASLDVFKDGIDEIRQVLRINAKQVEEWAKMINDELAD